MGRAVLHSWCFAGVRLRPGSRRLCSPLWAICRPAPDGKRGPFCAECVQVRAYLVRQDPLFCPFLTPQAAFANWCKRVLQTELLISPRKSTLTASGEG